LSSAGKQRRGNGSPRFKEAVMRSRLAVVSLVLAIAAFPAVRTTADDKPDQPRVVIVVERIQDLNLTDEQETKIADIQKENKPKVEEAAKDLATIGKEEMQKIDAVLTDEQRKKLAEVREERREQREDRLCERIAHLKELDLTEAEMAKVAEIRQEHRPKFEKALEGVKSVLNDDQKKSREESLNAGKKRKDVFGSLNLTEEQKQKIESAGKELSACVREELEKMKEVLTASQQEKLDEFKDERKERVRDRKAHAIATAKDLNLTEEQVNKITEIRKEFRPKIQEAGNKLRAACREEMEAILNVLKG
jgi:Spy/CpxP family protein refolding chaperone